MKTELYCSKSFSDAEGTRLVEGKIYKAEIIHDIMIVIVENRILMSMMDYLNNEWFLEHLKFHNVIPFTCIKTDDSVSVSLAKII